MTRIAVVGMACHYPDASSPAELWENALAGRRAFRRLPDVRMNLDDYWAEDPAAPDRFYARHAAVLEGYEFDRVGHRIAGSTYRSTDLTHWLALDTATGALADAGYPMAENLPRARTGVIVGNTLTGEFTRANVMRLRWPYVRRTVGAALRGRGWADEDLAAFLEQLEDDYKAPFPGIDEDTLAGGLSNTIAGRICNHFDLNGGGYTVDGACSSSLLSVVTACRALLDGEIDVAVAGGVDLSLDPFELIGFAKTGALARREMRVYDKGSNGFWPGEGCGMVVLMREPDADAEERRVYATIAGWGISSDGRGGITRPEVDGYRLALHRAYERAGFGIETVPLFEGHGTGTEVGDAAELTALSGARREADPAAAPAAIGTVKGMIGHTKAAAGVAGLIKAVMAVHRRVLPPTVGCVDPHPVLAGADATLRMLPRAEPWPESAAPRAGVTAMGFGGINSHIVLEGRGATEPVFDAVLASSVQDAELLLADGASPQDLRERLNRLLEFVPAVSYAQLSDVAATARDELRGLPYRAALVVSSPQEAVRLLGHAVAVLDEGRDRLRTPDVMIGRVADEPRLGYLFPGQGSGRGTSGGALRRRFAAVEEVYLKAALPSGGDMVATEVAQPRIVTGSLAGLRALSGLGLAASGAVGHSLGELSALCWAGALDPDALLRIAAVRGRAMAAHSTPGTMAGVAAGPEAAAGLVEGLPAVVAGYNGPGQTVVAGSPEAVEEVGRRAEAAGLTWSRIAVSHAFHSPLVAPAADAFGDAIAGERFGELERNVVSTVTGAPLGTAVDVPALLRRQITGPVLFAQAVERLAAECDLLIEVGPGQVLSGLAGTVTDVPAVALDTDDESIGALLRVAGAAFVTGAPVDTAALFRGRLIRPLEIGTEFSFLANPCERAPELGVAPAARTRAAGAGGEADTEAGGPAGESSLEMLRRMVAERAELPAELVLDTSRLLDDVHLSSITVGEIINRAAQALGLPASLVPANFATASLTELAQALDELAGGARPGDGDGAAPLVQGAAQWAHPFVVDLDEMPPPPPPPPGEDGPWQVHAPDGHPFAASLGAALGRAGVGPGVLVCMPEEAADDDVRYALDGAKEALAGTRFVLVEHAARAAALARTLRLEAPGLPVTIVRAPAGTDPSDVVVAEVAATTGFSETDFGLDGVRRVPTLRPLSLAPESDGGPDGGTGGGPLGADDVLLVTGGGKGITAECALDLAGRSGAALAVLGRSDPASDAELAANLKRMGAAGIRLHYARADVTDPAAVARAVAESEAALGPVTAVLHGAGRNEPAALAGLDLDAFRRTLAPKIDGLRAVLRAVDPGRLRLLVTFGSIIGRAGLRGEAHYAVANDRMAALTREVADAHPGCRCLCVEWSVWSGAGMGERLSVVESLAREGITPVPPDLGVDLMRRLLADPRTPAVVVVSGRTGAVDTVRYDLPELPLLRFVGRPLLRYHGVELVSEVELNAGTDLYLADHDFDGNLLFPAVFGMEAMTQVAVAATGRAHALPVIEHAEFLRPIVVPRDGATTIRVAATVTPGGEVQAAIRSAETGFEAEHFRARLRFPAEGDPAEEAPDGPPLAAAGLPPVELDAATELYGPVLFQGARFRRLGRYHRLTARAVDAEVTARPERWFAGYLPGDLLLGDPGARDSFMHGNQVCVPDATLLPVAVDRIHPAGRRLDGELRYTATERFRDGDLYVYDIAVRDGAGAVVERWEGLRLRAVGRGDGRGPWSPPLLGTYLERTLEEVTGGRVAVGVQPHGHGHGAGHGAGRRAMTALAAGRALGRPVEVRYRADGRPELGAGEPDLSASHGPGLTMCVAGPDPIGCDVEAVTAREGTAAPGRYGPLAERVRTGTGEDADTAEARVRAATECLRKAGAPPDAPLTLDPPDRPGWVTFASGSLTVATFAAALREVAEPVVFAIVTERRS